MHTLVLSILFFLFTNPPTSDIYTLSLHDALPISRQRREHQKHACGRGDSFAALEFQPNREAVARERGDAGEDRKSTRLNSSHGSISYAVFCLKKKTKK